jgi:ubiquinone biosynthesis protein
MAGSAIRRQSVLPALWFVILGVVISLLIGMVFLVVAGALVPSGSLPGPVYVARGTRMRLHRVRRYAQITRIVLRRGLAPYLRGSRRREPGTAEGRARLARAVRRALDDGGVIDEVLDCVGRHGGDVRAKLRLAGALTFSAELLPIDLATRAWSRRY